MSVYGFLTLLFPAVFYLFCLLVYLSAGGREQLRMLSGRCLVPAALISLAQTVFTVYKVGQNRYTYFWDFSTYWNMSCDLISKISRDPAGALLGVYVSICDRDYNKLLPLMVCCPLKLAGSSFVSFAAINCVMFLLPVYFITACSCLKLMCRWDSSKSRAKADRIFTAAFAGTALFPLLTRPAYLGYIDCAALIPSSLLLWILIDYSAAGTGKRQIKTDVITAVLLAAALLFRRYFAAVTVGYVAALLVNALLSLHRAGDKKRCIAAVIMNFAVIGVVSFGILALFPGFIKRVFFTDYSAEYVAYSGAFADKLRSFAGSIGAVILLCAAFAVILSAAAKKCRLITAELLVFSAVAALSLLRIQYMGPQHMYVVCAQLLLLSLMGLSAAWFIYGRRSVSCLSAVLALLCAGNYAYCYSAKIHKSLPAAGALFSTCYDPLVRDDIGELESLKDYLNSLTEGNGEEVYILASSYVLNSSMMRNLERPRAANAVNNLLGTHDIDLRDGFPAEFFNADIVVCTEPAQTHTAEGTQEVVRWLDDEVMDSSSPLGRHYRKCRTFSLDSGVTASVFLKTGDCSYEDRKYIAEYFTAYYPGQEDIFADRIFGR